MKYLVYLAPTTEEEGQEDHPDGPLQGPVATLEAKPRETKRTLRKRAILSSTKLQELAQRPNGVRLILVDAEEIEREPLRGSLAFDLS